PYWNLDQVLDWAFFGDRALVDQSGDTEFEQMIWREGRLAPDRGRRMVQVPARTRSAIKRELLAALRGAGTSAPVPPRLPKLDPKDFKPAVPTRPSERFIGVYASVDAAGADILRRLRDKALPVSGRGWGEGPREIIPPLQLLDAELDTERNRLIAKN